MNEVIQDIESVFPVSLQRSLQVTFCLRTTTCCVMPPPTSTGLTF